MVETSQFRLLRISSLVSTSTPFGSRRPHAGAVEQLGTRGRPPRWDITHAWDRSHRFLDRFDMFDAFGACVRPAWSAPRPTAAYRSTPPQSRRSTRSPTGSMDSRLESTTAWMRSKPRSTGHDANEPPTNPPTNRERQSRSELHEYLPRTPDRASPRNTPGTTADHQTHLSSHD